VKAVRYAGAAEAAPAPGVLDAIADATRVVICPSNPVLSIAPILAVPGIEDAVAARREDVVAVSPIVAGAALKGPADRIMVELGMEATVVGVARLYAPFTGTLVVDEADGHLAAAVEAEGVRCVVVPTVMHGVPEAAALAEAVLDA
jgi:LPPG:FO 2-phospho-L-lactate transferase